MPSRRGALRGPPCEQRFIEVISPQSGDRFLRPMASNDPRPVVPRPDASPPRAERKAPLSFEDAELFASRIRPSWELVDDAMREEVAAELAAPVAMGNPVGVPQTPPEAAEAPKADAKPAGA